LATRLVFEGVAAAPLRPVRARAAAATRSNRIHIASSAVRADIEKERIMRTISTLVVGVGLTIAISGCSRPTGLAAAAEAMGATGLNSIQYSGSGTHYAFGQAYSPGERWPRFELKTYTAAVDYQTPAMRLEMLRAQGENPPRGGGAQPFATEQRTIQVVSGTHAWAEGGAQPAPNPNAVGDRRRLIWVTPHGVIKAAEANNATVNGNVLTFRVEDRDVTVTLNDQNLVERVEYLTTNAVVGDVPVEITYSDYADFGGIQFPRHIVEKQDGFETLDIMVTGVQPNAAVVLQVPANVAAAPAPPASPMVMVEKVSDGVWSLNAANTRSLAVEFTDHIVVLEGPTSDARSVAVNETIRKTVPNKPIRYVVNTHAHYDHAGGLRAYVAEGITVVTHETNKAFFEQAWARPRTIAPDALSTSPRAPMIETVADKRVLADASRAVELYHLANHGHHTGQLIAYLPKERILLYGDGYNPPAGDDPRTPERGPEYGLQILDAVQRLKLNPERIAPVHGRVVPFENMRIALGVSKPALTE
jgi:glyoxylase-like metal-dependent hydrolase (beta-lactamase superfamily II)